MKKLILCLMLLSATPVFAQESQQVDPVVGWALLGAVVGTVAVGTAAFPVGMLIALSAVVAGIVR